ncbi:MAG: type IV toxin-antitoxin system AbiEi family antitoxin domain-containing protein [Actinomycetota bacterium]|nr:type IV toxin-antitoxin system AbiEi family antitoxin domain-containing protein [Actinomycetota bacterium]
MATVSTIKASTTALDRTARSQHGLVSTAQLTGLGIDANARKYLLRTGRLVGVRRGVYRLCGSRPSWRSAAMAAVLAVGEGAALSHRSAAVLWDLMDEYDLEGVLHLTAPGDQQVRLAGVRAYRRLLPPGQVTRRHHIPVTSIERTLIDLAGTEPYPLTSRLLDDVLRRKLTSMGRWARSMAAIEGHLRPGLGSARRLLADRGFDYDPGANDWEQEMDRMWDRLGLPPARRHHTIALPNGTRCIPDRAILDARIAVDWNGYGVHGLRSHFESDIERRNLLIAAGWTPLEFHSNQAPAHIARTVLRVYERAIAASLPAS